MEDRMWTPEAIDQGALRSAINTVRNWRARRLANGKAADRPEAARYAQERWRDMSTADIEAILSEVFHDSAKT